MPKTISPIERAGVIDIRDNGKAIEISSLQQVVTLEVNEESNSVRPLHSRPMLPSRIAVVGNYLPRRCGIATFTTDLCDAIHAEYGATELLALAGQRHGRKAIAIPPGFASSFRRMSWRRTARLRTS